jgi:hypothetical protein
MTAYVCEKIKDVMVSAWPKQDLDRVFIIETIKAALQQGLLTTLDVQAGLRYCCGSTSRRNEENIIKFLTVMAHATNYTDVAFVNRHFETDSDLDKQVKVAMLQHKGLWD